MNEVVWSSEPACIPLFYWLLNIRQNFKQIYPVSDGFICEKYRFEKSNFPMAAQEIGLSSQLVFFANNPH